MSLKAVEMQFALHKNDEAGLKQHQLNQKPVQDQAELAATGQKQMDHARQITSKITESSGLHIKDEGNSKEQGAPGQQSRDRSNENNPPKKERAAHPYKGKHIDLSL